MNLFQQILSVSKEFREHFEKENQQEERLKTVEEMLASGGGGSSNSIYSPYKKERLLLEFNGENLVIKKQIGADIIYKDTAVNNRFKIKDEYVIDGDIVKSAVTIAPQDKYDVCIPAFSVTTGRVNNSVEQHTISGCKHEIYNGIITLVRGEYNGLEMIENDVVFALNAFQDNTDNSTIRNFNIILEIEIHKPN